MRKYAVDMMAAAFMFLAILMIVAAAGMMDKGASVVVCIKLVAGSILSMIAGAGISGWRRF